MNGRVVDLHDVSKTFRQGSQVVHALQEVQLEVDRGEMLALHGRSGSGKTTLLNIVGGLEHADEGTVVVCGEDLRSLDDTGRAELRRDKVAFVFQSFGLLPVLSAAENVEVPFRLRRVDAGERTARVHELLEVVGLGERAAHRPHELSGGEQQRVAIARALANDPELLVADEPTGQLDSATGRIIMSLIRELVWDRGLTVLVATHDTAILSAASRLLELRDGRLQTR